jgi:lipopolysaccharide export system protein LptC
MGDSLTAATHIAGTHAWRASGPRDLARLIRKARRHSTRVRLMRIGVPAAAAVGGGVLMLATWFNPLRALPEMPVSVGNLVVSGTKITMEAPKLTGFTRDNRAYNLTAEAAAQDVTNPTVLELTGIRAKMEMQDKGIVDVTAVAGTYNTKSELLTLTQYIRLISSSGYEGHLTEASVDVRKSYIVSEKPVEVYLPNGKLNANRMEVIDNGALLRFDGGIILNLTPSEPGAADKKAPGR